MRDIQNPFDPDADCLRWSAFLERNLEGDQERIALLQEWYGLCLTRDTNRQKFLVMEGEGANGKSVACAALSSSCVASTAISFSSRCVSRRTSRLR